MVKFVLGAARWLASPRSWAVAGLGLFSAHGSSFGVACDGVAESSSWRLWSRPTLDVTVMAGAEDVFFELRHGGAPVGNRPMAAYSNTIDGTPNPAPALFRCLLRWKGQREAGRTSRDGESWVLPTRPRVLPVYPRGNPG